MKKVISFIIFSCVIYTIFIPASLTYAADFKQGFYKTTDLNLSLETTHTIQNNSFSDRSLVIILDSNQIIKQVLRLNPQSEKYKLVPLEQGYLVIIAGGGEVSII
ncbi:MAG: hypothetical protein K0R54_4184 [Clostridiaceae bacterium]|jgi:hypothetical protein|nr:hypothetical protein [Clostridiaceae bacterium]